MAVLTQEEARQEAKRRWGEHGDAWEDVFYFGHSEWPYKVVGVRIPKKHSILWGLIKWTTYTRTPYGDTSPIGSKRKFGNDWESAFYEADINERQRAADERVRQETLRAQEAYAESIRANIK